MKRPEHRPPRKPPAGIRRLLPRDVRGMQLLLLLVVLLPVLLVEALKYHERFETQRSAESRANLELARSLAGTFDGYVQDVLRQEMTIGVVFTSNPPVSPELEDQLLASSVREYPTVEFFSYVDPSGRVVASSNSGALGHNVADRSYFREILGGRPWAVSDLIAGCVFEEAGFTIARGVRDQSGALRGVVVASIVPQHLDQVLRIERAGQGSVSVMDRSGLLVYQHPETDLSWEQRRWLERQPLEDRSRMERAWSGEEVQGAFLSGMDGQEEISALVPVRTTGWVVASSRPTVEVVAPITRGLARDLGLLLLVSVAAFLSALLLGRWLTGPLTYLREHALAVGRGEVAGWVEVRGPVEVEALAEAYNRMAAEIKERDQQREGLLRDLRDMNQRLVVTGVKNRDLVEEAQRARHRAQELAWALSLERDTLNTIMENTRTHLAYLDPQFNFIRVNSAYAQGSGHPKEELIGRNHFELFPNAENQAVFEKVRDTGEPVEFRAKPFDFVDQPWRGTTYWDWTLVPVKDGDGRVQGLAFSLMDVTEQVLARKRVEELAARAEATAGENARLYREAQEAVALRDEFLSVAAHELKTPVTSLRGFAQFIVRQIDRGSALDPERLRRALQVIDQQSDRLARLMNQLLDISRLEAGRLALDRKVTEINSLVECVVATVETSATGHELVLNAPETVSAMVDPLRLEQVVSNLVDNAVKYSPQGGAIEIELVKAEGDQVRLSVRDHGVGIPLEHRERIFDRFYQAHGEGHYGGMGLGLYISRHIVELHRGRIEVESPEDGGTRFVVSLPAGAGAGSEPLPRP